MERRNKKPGKRKEKEIYVDGKFIQKMRIGKNLNGIDNKINIIIVKAVTVIRVLQ